MTRLLPKLHEGHAPIFLHQAFDDALEAFERWTHGAEEPEVDFEGAAVPISSIFGRMRSCTDILPARVLDALRAIVGPRADEIGQEPATYASAAFLLRALSIERLKAGVERS